MGLKSPSMNLNKYDIVRMLCGKASAKQLTITLIQPNYRYSANILNYPRRRIVTHQLSPISIPPFIPTILFPGLFLDLFLLSPMHILCVGIDIISLLGAWKPDVPVARRRPTSNPLLPMPGYSLLMPINILSPTVGGGVTARSSVALSGWS